MDSQQRRRSLAGIGGVTDAALVRIVQKIREDPHLVEDVGSRYQIMRALRSLEGQVCMTQELQLKAVNRQGRRLTYKLLHAAPNKILDFYIRECPGFAGMLWTLISVSPPTHQRPWHVVFYVDEITPGNPIRTDNKRKIVVFYFNFLELGPEILCREDAWLPITVVRSPMLRLIRGGLSAVLRALTNEFFQRDEGWSKAGIVLELEIHTLCFFVYARLLGDADALKLAWGNKGASGNIPCMVCKNCATVLSEIADFDESGYMIDITCHVFTKFDLATDAEVWEKHDMLTAARAAGITKGRLDEMEKDMGQKLVDGGILEDVPLREVVGPVTSNRYDSLHCLAANGTCHSEVTLLLKAMKAAVLP